MGDPSLDHVVRISMVEGFGAALEVIVGGCRENFCRSAESIVPVPGTRYNATIASGGTRVLTRPKSLNIAYTLWCSSEA